MKRKTKGITIDAMVKFIFTQYGVPTKKDVALILKRLGRIENLLQETQRSQRRRSSLSAPYQTATDQVLHVMSTHPTGLRVVDLEKETGLPEKTVRNIIFRLNKLGKIRRSQRGIYAITK